jgi:biopolymer transport protein ExbB/TolQ
MMMLAQTAPWDAPVTIGSWLGCLLFVVLLFNALGKAYDRFTGKSKVPQPMNVEIVKALHEQFADKKIFEEQIKHTTKRHGELFAAIARVEREAREAMEYRFADLNKERAASLEKLAEQFTFIRENLAAINNELKIRTR